MEKSIGLIGLLAAALAAPAAAQERKQEPRLSFWAKEVLVLEAPKGSTIKLDRDADIYESTLLLELAPEGATVALPRTEDSYGLELLEALAEERHLAAEVGTWADGAAANGAAKRRAAKRTPTTDVMARRPRRRGRTAPAARLPRKQKPGANSEPAPGEFPSRSL